MPVRLKIKLKSVRPIPVDHQASLYKGFKMLLPENKMHNEQSFYTFSRINLVDMTFMVSFLKSVDIVNFANGVIKNNIETEDPLHKTDGFIFGSRFTQNMIEIKEPEFKSVMHYFSNTPLVLQNKNKNGDRSVLYYDIDADSVLTKSIIDKIKKTDPSISTNGITAKFINKNKGSRKKEFLKEFNGKKVYVVGSLCNIEIVAPIEAQRILWYSGIGLSTGIGYGFISELLTKKTCKTTTI